MLFHLKKNENIRENKFKSNISKRFDNIINLILLFFINSVMVYQISPKDVNNKIVLQLEKIGLQQVLYSNFPFIPSHIYLNLEEVNFSNYYYLDIRVATDKISLIWIYEFNNTKDMFKGLNNIISIDLNDFDSGSINDIEYMFHVCTNLKILILVNLIQKMLNQWKIFFIIVTLWNL